MNNEDIPLTDAFFENPLEYMQTYVRNLNNEIFLSQYHINNLYTLLLIGRNSPWDNIKGNSERIKEQIDVVVNQKVHDVKTILESLSNVYEDKAKKSAITQIQKLMGILKSKKKSIFIEKEKNAENHHQFHFLNKIAEFNLNRKKQDNEQNQIQNETQTLKEQDLSQETELAAVSKEETKRQEHRQETNREEMQSEEVIQQHQCSGTHHHHHSSNEQYKINVEAQPQTQQRKSSKLRGNNEVFSIFYGIANLSNLSALALTNILEYNSSQRFIKFKMSQNYNMTIKNEDPLYFDRRSSLSSISADLYVNQIFPYLSASELFSVRSVCKEWMQNVKDAWHSTFKRQMYTQLLACQFCKDIEFYYKTIQLRNPFFQKLSLLIHALIEIIQWDSVYLAIQTNNLTLQLKRILIIILRLTGEPIPLTNLNAINDAFFDQYKSKMMNLKERAMQFFSTLSGSDMTINDFRAIKVNFLDDPFMRVEEINSQDKSPLLLTLFAKQMTLQQILRNHIFLCQEYLLNTKKRLDNVSKKMVYQKGYLEGVYKILLLKSSVEPLLEDKEQSELPNFHQMLQSIFTNKNSDKPDFVIRSRSNSTEIFLDNATKLDLILTTVYNLEEGKGINIHQHNEHNEDPKQVKESTEAEEKGIQTEPRKQLKNQIVNQIDLKIECKQQSMDEFPPSESVKPNSSSEEQNK